VGQAEGGGRVEIEDRGRGRGRGRGREGKGATGAKEAPSRCRRKQPSSQRFLCTLQGGKTIV